MSEDQIVNNELTVTWLTKDELKVQINQLPVEEIVELSKFTIDLLAIFLKDRKPITEDEVK